VTAILLPVDALVGGMWVDLSQPFSGDMPHSDVLPAPEFEMIKDVTEDDLNVQQYSVSTHVGTHVDAPRHFIEGGETIDELALDRFAGEAVVLDCSQDQAGEITVDDIDGCEGAVEEDDIVLLYTGWEEKYGTAAYEPHPWLSVELAEWFVDRNIKLLGVDTTTPDIPTSRRPDGWTEHPVHRSLLGNGVLVAEHLTNLASHTGHRLQIQGFPIKIVGGDGAPARFVGRR
jgi:arylformamidase